MNLRAATALSWRSVMTIARQPALIFPSVFFPLFFAALSTASFQRTTNLPGFPEVDSFLDFLLAATIVQGVVFGAISGGQALADDIEGGFFDRLAAAPVPGAVILVGRLAGSALVGAVQALAFTAILVAFGAGIAGGLPSLAALVVVSAVLAVAIGGFACTIALRTGSNEAVQAFFPLFFVGLFTSSAFFPRDLMSGWFKAVAGANPLSWMIEDIRHLTITGFAAGKAGQAMLIVLGMSALSIAVAVRALRRRTLV